MTQPGLSPYDTVAPFLGSLPSWAAGKLDQQRLASYDFYDQAYKNAPKTFALVQRGTDQEPIYIPSGKSIVEACNRYLAVDFDYNMTINGSSDGPEVETARLVFDQFLRRVKFWSRFVSQKRFMLIRGDAIWHVLFYNNQLLLQELDPRSYFPITAIDDIDEVLGCHIVKRMQDPANPNTTIVRRQTYMIVPPANPANPPTIQSSMDWYQLSAWDDRINPDTLLPYQQSVKPLAPNPLREKPFSITLPPQITKLPIYHIRNNRVPLDPFGTSLMLGIERLIAGINQGVSDEELALALDGLGMYWTTSGPPMDENGNPTNWVLGPGRVVEVEPNSTFGRVPGIGSIAPSIDHLKFLIAQMKETAGISDIAVGNVTNVHGVQSGIALALQMLPLLSQNKERETELIEHYDELFNDIMQMWMPAYGLYTPPQGLDIVPTVGDPMPVDRDSVVNEVVALLTANIITVREAQSILQERLGYEFKFSSPEELLKQESELAAARDPFGRRLADEMDAGLNTGGDSTNTGDTAKAPAPTGNTTPPGA